MSHKSKKEKRREQKLNEALLEVKLPIEVSITEKEPIFKEEAIKENPPRRVIVAPRAVIEGLKPEPIKTPIKEEIITELASTNKAITITKKELPIETIEEQIVKNDPPSVNSVSAHSILRPDECIIFFTNENLIDALTKLQLNTLLK